MSMKEMMLAGLMAATVLTPTAHAQSDWTRGRTEQRAAPRAQPQSPQPRQQVQQQSQRAQGQPQGARPAPSMQDRRTDWQQGRQDAGRDMRTQPSVQARPQVARDDRRDWRQDTRDDRRDWRQDARNDSRDARQDARSDRRDWRQDRNGQPGRVVVRDGRTGTIRQDWRDDRQDARRDWRRNASDWRSYDDRSRWTNQRRWDNGWRNDRRYDWRAYRDRNRYIYNPGRYYAPRGWSYGYQPFYSGYYADSVLFGRSYWLDDPYQYRLPPAYGSMRWIRYYDDALLVDIRDGYVVDVIRNFFW